MRARAPVSHRVAIRFVATGAFDDPEVADGALAHLSTAERESLFRLRSAGARRDYLAAHVLTRTTLTQFAGGVARRLEFRISSLGKPSLAGPPDLCRLSFSTAHADGMAICAVGDRVRLGADVETLRNVGSDDLAIAELVASRSERRSILAASGSARAGALLAIWTLKEALTKATGIGLRFPVRNVTVVGSGGVPLRTPIFDLEPPADAPRWHLACRHLSDRHLAAVAVTCPPGDLVDFEFERARVRAGA